MTPNYLARQLDDDKLRQLASEALRWRSTGLLTGEALRLFAEVLATDAAVESDEALRVADSTVVIEAARRFVGQ